MLSVPVFFFNDTATTEIYTLSLHDALPISFQVPLARQEFWEMAKGPVMVTLLTDMPTEPVLDTWTICPEPRILTATEPNVRLAGETETEATGATPAPARVTG